MLERGKRKPAPCATNIAVDGWADPCSSAAVVEETSDLAYLLDAFVCLGHDKNVMLIGVKFRQSFIAHVRDVHIKETEAGRFGLDATTAATPSTSAAARAARDSTDDL